MKIGRVLRTVAAVSLLIGGLVHLQLYFGEGYRHAGNDGNIGRSFIANAVASAIAAALVFALRNVIVRVFGLLVALGTLLAFTITRTSDALFGFKESGMQPSPQAAIALFVEVLAVICLALTFLPSVEDDTDEQAARRPRLLGIGAAVAAIAMIGFGIYWANSAETVTATGSSQPPSSSDGGTAAPSDATAVTIQNFSFNPPSTTVKVGSTVTWTNADSATHSISSSDNIFKSDPLPTGSTYQFTFDKAGTFAYVCGIHPSMHGTIVVTG